MKAIQKLLEDPAPAVEAAAAPATAELYDMAVDDDLGGDDSSSIVARLDLVVDRLECFEGSVKDLVTTIGQCPFPRQLYRSV